MANTHCGLCGKAGPKVCKRGMMLGVVDAAQQLSFSFMAVSMARASVRHQDFAVRWMTSGDQPSS